LSENKNASSKKVAVKSSILTPTISTTSLTTSSSSSRNLREKVPHDEKQRKAILDALDNVYEILDNAKIQVNDN